MTLQEAFYSLKKELQALYDAGEATAIAHEILNHITGLSKFERLLEKEQTLTPHQQAIFDDAQKRLLQAEPLQYVVGEQWFMGNVFEVNKDVLIPRPETEELVQWIVRDWQKKNAIHILDIGSGSGCIPVSLKLQLPQATITSIDISREALIVAQRNAFKHEVEIDWKEMDFLDEKNWLQLAEYDVIVSNPPYIPMREKNNLHSNVLEHEPSLALFVPDEDALLFYRKIAQFSTAHLKKNAAVYCEVHKAHAYETQALFDDFFTAVTLRKDMNENERMVKGIR